jgi:endonuclease/exonuclease/phosphatase family metal-dependent hydrolase
MECDIIGLQEIESLQALKALQKELKRQGSYFPYFAITSKKKTSVHVAILSKYPIVYSKELTVTSHRKYRNILETGVKIATETIYIFTNHWKAKSDAESRRIISAKVLKKRMDELGTNKPIVLLGDFNSHYEEHLSFKRNRKHNDTKGITGINHILQTIHKNQPVTLESLSTCKNCSSNLWYDYDEEKRWTHIFRSSKEALDSIIVTHGMLDEYGIEYIKGSLRRFTPAYLLKRNKPFRWQTSRSFPKHHIGKGFSDHLPIYADFKTTNTN